MSNINHQLHGFRFAEERLAGNRDFWAYCLENPSEAASIRVMPQLARENLAIYDRFSGRSYQRLVTHEIKTLAFQDLEWKFTKNEAIPKGTLIQIDSVNVANYIQSTIENFQPNKEAAQVEVSLGDGLIIKGDIIRVSPFKTRGQAHILPLDNAEIEYRTLKSGNGTDFSYLGRLKNPQPTKPLAFQIITEVKFGDELIERITQDYFPVFKKHKRFDSPSKFSRFLIKEPSREFMLETNSSNS